MCVRVEFLYLSGISKSSRKHDDWSASKWLMLETEV